MFKIDFKVTGKRPEEFIANVDVAIAEMFNKIESAGKATQDTMVTVIEANKTRSGAGHENSKPLADTIEKSSTYINDAISVFVGIGKIVALDNDSPAYRWINDGIASNGTRIPGGGKFVPGYWEGDVFHYEPYSGSGMVPKNPLFTLAGAPFHYIEAGENFMRRELEKIIRQAKNRIER